MLTQHGARLALLDIHASAGRALAQELGSDVLFEACDVTRGDQVAAAVDLVLRRFGQIDILVNVVGGSTTTWFWELTEQQWDQMIEFNLKTTFLTCRAVVPHMLERRQGSIINISSNQAVTPAPMRSHYSAAKAGIIGLSRTLAMELAPYGVRVNVVAPGPTNTERVRSHFTDEGWAERNADHPLGRVAEPNDVAEAILFLASPRSEDMTGQVLHVNGGLYMP